MTLDYIMFEDSYCTCVGVSVCLCDLSIPNGCMFSENEVVRSQAGINIFLLLRLRMFTLRNCKYSGRESPRYARSRAQAIPRDTYSSSHVSQLTVTPHIIPGQADPESGYCAPRQISDLFLRYQGPTMSLRLTRGSRSPVANRL